MYVVLESNYLVPNATFWVVLLVVLVLAALLVAWPLVESLALRQWGYALAILVLGPFAGLVWLTKGRRETDRLRRAPVRSSQT